MSIPVMGDSELCVRTSVPGLAQGGERRGTRGQSTGVGLEQVARRLQRRRAMVLGKRKLCNACLLLAVVGIGLMITSTELAWNRSQPYIVETLGVVNTALTLLLLALTLAYHRTSVQLLMMDEDMTWRTALTLRRRVCLALEVLVCLLHPFPFVQRTDQDGSPSAAGILLSAVMFLRLHWVGRAVFLNSPLLDPSYQALGSLSKVRLHFPFALKVLMETCGGKILLVFVSSLWLIGSWTLSLCERTNNVSGGNQLLESMWLIPITFLTIGYGDVSPLTICGKFICLLTGIVGVSCTALLIAVISQKLQLCSDEKHVHSFMQEMRLRRQVKRAAADLIGAAWLLHKRGPGSSAHRSREDQRSLVAAIRRFRNAKLQERRLRDQINSMMGSSKMYVLLQNLDQKLVLSCTEFDKRLTTLTDKVDGLASGIDELAALFHSSLQQPPRH